MADKTLDTKGMACPIPVLKAKKALAEVPPGGTLEVLATDPASVEDFKALAKSTGATLAEQTEQDGVSRPLLKKAA